jgi:hypothetical protein
MDEDIFAKESAESFKLLPWSDWQQWEQVFKQVFSSNNEEQWNGIKIVTLSR